MGSSSCPQQADDEDVEDGGDGKNRPFEILWLRYLVIFGTSPPALSRRQWLVMLLLTACGFFKSYDEIIWHLVLPQLQKDLGISDGGVSFLAAFLSLGGVFGIPLLVAADVYGRRAVLLFTILPYSILTGLTAFSRSWVYFAACQLCAGIFLSGEHLVSQVVIIEEMPSHCRGWAVGVLAAATSCGSGLAMLLFGFVGDRPGGWRWLYGLAGLPLLVLASVRRNLPETSRFQAHKSTEARLDACSTAPCEESLLRLEMQHVGRPCAYSSLTAGVGAAPSLAGDVVEKPEVDIGDGKPHADSGQRCSCGVLPRAFRPLQRLFQESGWQAQSVLALMLLRVFSVAPGNVFEFKYLQQAHGMAASEVSVIGILGGGIALGSFALAGQLSDRLGRRRIASCCFVISGVIGALYYLMPGGRIASRLVRLVWVLMVACNMALGTLVSALTLEIFPTSHRTTAQSLAPLAVSVAAPLGILVEGLLARALGPESEDSRSGHWRACAIMSSLSVLCAPIVALRFPETAGCNLEDIGKPHG